MNLSSFMLATLLFMDPLHKHFGEDEDPSARLGRISTIANDLAEVCQDPDESPIFNGPDGRVRTCILLASIARNESGFKLSVDSGEEKGDGGHSVCMMQINLRGRKDYTEEELIGNRKACIRAGLRILRSNICHKSDTNEMLRGYVSGSCNHWPDNPKKESIITATASGDASGYNFFFSSFKKIPTDIVVQLSKPNYTVSQPVESAYLMENVWMR